MAYAETIMSRDAAVVLADLLAAEAHLHRSRCHVGTFLYVRRDVTSNMMIAHFP